MYFNTKKLFKKQQQPKQVAVKKIAAILYINSYWRCMWFYFIENCIDSCNYFVVANFRKFSNFKR